ncbi:MAG: peptidoglycan-binding domain-containing protein [Hyphomicrobiaceae bacterium]
MSKTTGLVGAVGAFGALAYLMAPLPPETPPADAVATASTAVAAAPTPVPQPAPAASAPSGGALPAPSPDATVLLIQQIQSELLRLGCYGGPIDGRWSPATQQAMLSLGERLRVLRPVDKPDYIMLALARGQASHGCAPQGQATASRRPARIVPMVAPSETTTERAAKTPRRPAERSPGALEASRAGTGAPPEIGEAAISAQRRLAEPLLDRAGDEHIAPPRGGAPRDQDRMGLGIAPGAAARTGIDPRDLTDPATLRDPLTATPRAALERAEVETEPAREPRDAGRGARDARPTGPQRSSRNDWKRAVFIKMREAGP